MMRFLTSSASRGAGLGAAEVFGAGQFIARVVDDAIGLQPGRSVGAKAVNLLRKNDEDEHAERFQQQRGNHAPVGSDPVWSFPGQSRTRPCKGRTDRGDELVPRRGPLDQELGRVMKLDRVFELEGIGHWSGLEPVFLTYERAAARLKPRPFKACSGRAASRPLSS
jgi:hypothetical protein